MAIQVLPDHILKFDNNIFVRIFKLLGTLSAYIVITDLTDRLSSKFYFFVVIAFLYGVYKIIISIYAVINFIKMFREGKLFVRNSPIDV